MKAFFSYLKKNSFVLAAFVCAGILFALIFSLYSLPLEPILYASILCFFVFLILFWIRFSSYRKRLRILSRIQKTLIVSEQDLPKPAGNLEQEYQSLILALEKARNDLSSDTARALSDMTDYYTLWAHQIKTPIAAMRLILQSADTSPEHTELSDQLFKIEQYVEMALCYLRAENLSADLVLKQVSLDTIVKSAFKKYARPFFRKKIGLQYKNSSLTVLTDEKWLSFVIEQLLSNALKYTDKGRISVFVKDQTLFISDTGIGIRPEDLPRIGEKGFTGFNGHEDKKSTGIGLYLSKRILQNLSHEFAIESEVGRGTTVSITFADPEMRHD